MRHSPKNPTRYRLQQMTWTWLTVGFIYGTTRFTPGDHWLIPPVWLDNQIPYHPVAIWLYLGFFFLIPWTFFNIKIEKVRMLREAIQISAAVSGLVFMIVPSSLEYPLPPSQGINAALIRLLLAIDTAQNCFPSLHGALTCICLLALWDRQKKGRSLGYLAITLAMGFSIIQLRRHLTIDLGAGVLVGMAAYYLAERLATHRKGVLSYE